MFNYGDVVTNGEITAVVIANVCERFSKNPQFLLECERPCHRYSFEYLMNYYKVEGKDTEQDKIKQYEDTMIEYHRYPLHTMQMLRTIDSDFDKFIKLGVADMPKFKFNIGDKVVTKKTGPVNIGIIGGITDKGYKYMSHSELWDRLCPGWKCKPIYYLTLDKANKNLTRKEYVVGIYEQLYRALNTFPESLAHAISKDLYNKDLQNSILKDIENSYDINVKESYSLAVPEDDIGIIE